MTLNLAQMSLAKSRPSVLLGANLFVCLLTYVCSLQCSCSAVCNSNG